MSSSDNTRLQIIADLQRRVDDQLLEKENFELLKKLIENADTLSEAILISELGTTWKRTGFHFDKRLEKMSNSIQYLSKNNKLSFYTSPDAITHKLIIGDNYPALLNLNISYHGMIDVIYIDPPYGKDKMGDFAETNYDNAITRDNLLSMLYPRLLIARQLLSDEGIIFCSIDDKNHAYVKCLFDEVFGERNFIASIPRKTGAGNAAARGDAVLRKPFDYLLLYKNSEECSLQKKVVGEKEYPLSDEYGKFSLSQFHATGSDATRRARPNLYYPIYADSNGRLTLEKPSGEFKTFLPPPNNGEDGRWMWQKKKFIADSEKLLYFDGEKISRKIYYDPQKDQNKYQVEQAWLAESQYSNANGTKMLKNILNKRGDDKVIFDNPKPIDLIKWCIKLCGNQDAVVLDFFAGSGTTGQAVLDLNREDDGNRQFILCTNNEITDKNPNGIAIDVTSKRLKRVMTGCCYDGFSDFEWLDNNQPYGDNLEVCDISEVANFESSEGKTPFDVIDETLYGKDKITSHEGKIKWVCENFERTQKRIEE